MALLWAFLGVWIVIFAVPLIIYGIMATKGVLKAPEHASPARFLAGIAFSKLGTALTFVLIFQWTLPLFVEKLCMYAALWVLMFAMDEIGQVISGNQSWQAAVAGVISESIYFPMAASWAARIFT